MCGRANLHDSEVVRFIMEQAGLPPFPSRPPRYNICPADTLDVLTQHGTIEPQTWSIEFGTFRHPNTKVATLKRRASGEIWDPKYVSQLEGKYRGRSNKPGPKL